MLAEADGVKALRQRQSDLFFGPSTLRPYGQCQRFCVETWKRNFAQGDSFLTFSQKQ